MSFERNVAPLTSQSLYEAMRVCETLPGYRVLVCVNSTKARDDFLRSIDELLLANASYRRPRRAKLCTDAQYGEDFVLFKNKSMLLVCTDLTMNTYAQFGINMVLVHDGCRHSDATTEYAKSIIVKYVVPNEYETNRETFADRLRRHMEGAGFIKSGIDTDSMDSFLEGI